jgi:hypothetical protein
MAGRVLSRQEIDDFLAGAEILGTGGGGNLEGALARIKYVEEHGKKIRLIDPREVPDDAVATITGALGGGVSEEVRQKIMKKFGAVPRQDLMKTSILAEKMMAGYLGEEISAFMAFELGCGNTILPACIAAVNDKPVVDGDFSGRSVPQTELCTLNLKEIPFTPVALVTPWMETMLIKRAADYSRIEDLMRCIAVASGGSCLVLGPPLRGKTLSDSIVKNTVTGAMKLGRAIRGAKEKGRDPVEAAVRAVEGYLLFRGRVTDFKREGGGGFMWGEHKYEGVDEFKGRKFRVWYKNENMISWLDNKPYVTCPDSLCVMDTETGRGLSNWGTDFTEGRRTSVIGIKAAGLWRTPRGLEIFNPRFFDFDIDYKPVEELCK